MRSPSSGAQFRRDDNKGRHVVKPVKDAQRNGAAVTAAGMRVLIFSAAAAVIVYAGIPVSHGGRTHTVGVQRLEVLEHSLQAKPSLEATQVAYADQIGRIADQVSALVDGVHWTLRTNVERGCGMAYAGTDAEQVYLNVGFSAPIPDDEWPQAVQIVREGAVALAATDYRDYVDRSGIHAIQVASPDGGDIWLGTAKTATLTARSDCRISERTNAAQS